MQRSHQISIYFKLVFTLLCSLLVLSGCRKEESEPIKIGFIGGTSGRFYRLGIDGRDGSVLAVERANAAGGINGRLIKLIIRDDKQNKEALHAAFTDLHNEQVAAVIGPFTSSMAVALAPLANQLNLVTVGPTISTNKLSGIDDFFLRNYPTSDQQAMRLADHIAQTKKIKRISIIYDLSNKEHTESWSNSLRYYFEKLGGQIVATRQFDSAENKSYLKLAENLLTTPTEGVFILANSRDTGLICQQLKKLGFKKPLFASEWSFTEDLLRIGGSSVEGMTIFHSYNPQDRSPRFLEFSSEFELRFGRKPSFVSVHAYDSTNLLLTGLKAAVDPLTLKETLLELPELNGVQNNFRLNRYGDAERELYLTKIKDGAFILGR